MTATRRQAREWAIQILTAADLNPHDDVRSFVDDVWDEIATADSKNGEPPGGKPKAFAEERVFGVLESTAKIDAVLSSLLDNWDIARLGTVERAVLRMGIWEMSVAGIPPPVVINEAIDLANWFSSPKSRPLINGVLDKYAKTIAPGAAAK
jgi:N utilization substance protein B